MKSEEPIAVAVIGVGHLGSRHARVYADLIGANLVGVADIIPERAREIADQYGCMAVEDYRELAPKIRAASVAVPTVSHNEVTRNLIEAGVDVLVEKPIASTGSEAREMVELADARDRILAVGHTERFNPAVAALLGQSNDPRFIEVHRLGAFTSRSLDIDAVLDLMIHDLDIVSALVRSEVVSIEAVGVPVLTGKVDIANARLRFDNGCVANLTASRISQEKVRKLRVWERERYVSVDYLNQEALSYRLIRSSNRIPEIDRQSLAVEREEPLKLELMDFLGAVGERRAPLVSGQEGQKALQFAIQVIEAMEE